MSTRTITELANAQPSRQYDCLYDPTWTVSSKRDFNRERCRALCSTENVQCIPNFRTMFSDLAHYARCFTHIYEPVPPHFSCDWMPQRATLPETECSAAVVAGRDRFKFFKSKPVGSEGDEIPSGVQIAPAPRNILPLVTEESIYALPPEEGQRTCATQTDFRESEAQTLPWSPPYRIPPGTHPEELTLLDLTYGRGLPAGALETEMIRRARMKRIWEDVFSSRKTTVGQAREHSRAILKMKQEEVRIRTKEIEQVQELQLQDLRHTLTEWDGLVQRQNREKLDALWEKKLPEMKLELTKIKHKTLRRLRNLTRERELERRKKGGIDRTYGDFSAPIEVPPPQLSITGREIPSRLLETTAKKRLRTTTQALEDLEAVISSREEIDNLPHPPKSSELSTRLVDKHRAMLKELQEHLEAKHPKEARAPIPLEQYRKKVEHIMPRPLVPTVVSPSVRSQDINQAAVILQKVIRGRAEQKKMQENREKFKDLIKELSSDISFYSLYGDQPDDRILKQQLQQQYALWKHQDQRADAALVELEGNTIGFMLDFLSKELLRYQEEQRLLALAKQAEEERRIREAKESELRQKELQKLKEDEEKYNMLKQASQSLADSYLAGVLVDSVTAAATEMANLEAERASEQWFQGMVEDEERLSSLDIEALVSEMVHAFIIPEAARQLNRAQLDMQRARYSIATYATLYGSDDQAEEDQSSRNASGPAQ